MDILLLVQLESMLLLLLLLLPCVLAFVPQKGLPVYLHTRGGGPTVLVASIATGPARVPRLYALLATGAPEVQTRDAGAGAILWIANVPRQFDATPLAGPVPGCDICHGILPIGKSSPLWTPYATVTFTGDAILFDETRVASRPPGVPCLFALEGLCDLPATFNGVPTTLRLDFSRPETLVPDALFFDYVQDNHPTETPARKWDDVRIEAAGETVVIPGAGVVSTHLGFTPQLFFEPHAGSEVRVGADLLRFASVYWDIGANTVSLEPRVTSRGFSWFTAALIVVCVVIWYQLRDLHRPGRLAVVLGSLSVLLAAGVGVLLGRILADDVVLLVLTCSVFGVTTVGLLATLLARYPPKTVRWLWIDHVRTTLALINVFLATFFLTLEPRVYYYSTLPTTIISITWLYTTYEQWTVMVRDTRTDRSGPVVISWVVFFVWALMLTVGLHALVFIPTMLSYAPGGGATPTLALLCFYASLALAASYVVGPKHKENKKFLS